MALSTTASSILGDASPRSMRESSLSRSRTFSPRKKKKLKVPGFLRMKGKHHYRRRKHKVAIQTGATLEERGGAVCKNKPTDAFLLPRVPGIREPDHTLSYASWETP
ncbi:hypothetical protein MRX96_048731 [Rhipicephalus microplus]